MSSKILIPHDELARQEMLTRASKGSKTGADTPQAADPRLDAPASAKQDTLNDTLKDDEPHKGSPT